MKMKLLGKSGIEVSELAFGCMSLETYQAFNQQLLEEAIDNGINFFDTADVYQKGWNEECVGKALKSKRKQVVLASKVGNVWQQDSKPFKWDPSAKHILHSIDQSLKRLQTDYLDLYQLHGGTIEDSVEETIDAFEILKKAGKIRAYGISSIRPNVIRKYLQSSNIDSVMMQYSLLDRRPEEEALKMIAQKNVSVLARGVLAQGLLAGKASTAYLGNSKQNVESLVHHLNEMDLTPSTLAVQYILQNSAVTSAVMGMRTHRQLNNALAAINAHPPDQQTIEELKQSIPALTYTEHR